ncbi:MAG: DevR family CRISPR-associated autoregulator [Firmicutes bacterium]|nr:DevR family CRISPR-associated autoregulator [Bacillota bacterium]
MKLHSLAISGLLNMNLHSLNNEGAEGNHLMTRQVQIVDEKGHLHSVNAISGDMFKHIQAEYLFQLAKEEGLPLCQGCAVFDANRISADAEFANSFSEGATNEEILHGVLRRCVLDDAEGILITRKIGGKDRSIGRKSAVEFGWVVGHPERTHTDSYFHVKFDNRARADGSGDEANLGQNIFHRPASSGQYAVVLNVDLYRLGLNDISREYALSAAERKARAQALLKSILFTFLKPSGAQRNTQNPHILAFEGAITLSHSTYPAPQASALNLNYLSEIEGLVDTLNSLESGAVSLLKFDSLASFASCMESIIGNFDLVGA